jgi:hypothetical protein
LNEIGEAIVASDSISGNSPTKVLSGLEHTVAVMGKDIKGRPKLDVAVPGFGIDGQLGELRVVAERGEELEVGGHHGG